MTDAEVAWAVYTANQSSIPPQKPNEHTVRALQAAGLSQSMAQWTLRHHLAFLHATVPKLLQSVCLKSHQKATHLLINVSTAHTHFIATKQSIESLEATLPECAGLTRHFLLRARVHLDASLPSNFSIPVYDFLVAHLLQCESGSQPREAPRLTSKLVELGFARVVEDALSWAVFERMDALVASRTTPSTSALPDLLHWVDAFATPAVATLLPTGVENTVERWKKRLVFHLHETVCNIRTKQLLQLIDKFPETTPALTDLRDSLLSTDQKPVVARALRDQFVDSLLNAGTVTADILQQYVNTIRALRFLDPTGVILACVSEPIRDYLRKRPDTVRCIVSGITGDGDLYEELERGRKKKPRDGDGDVQMRPESSGLDLSVRDEEDEDCLSIDGDFGADMRVDADEYAAWQPDPIDAPVREGKWRACGDAIATLVTIYGTSEQIVNEYKGLLADKLVSSFDFDQAREEGILELLSERFGKEALHDCSVMLMDVQQSAHTLQVARARSGGTDGSLRDFEATVISKEFWPNLVDEVAFKGPEQVQQQMAVFSQAFSETKRGRSLRWQHGLGVVEVQLQFDDGREVTTTVTPMQATMLWHFGRNSRLNVKDLQKEMGVEDESVFRRKLQALSNQGFLRAVNGKNEVYETVEDGVEVEGALDDDDANGEGENEEGEEAAQAEMAVYETYVMAMLQNLKQLSLEQIDSMLRRFVQTPVYDKTEAQLAAFMTSLVQKEKVELTAGVYRIKK